jgi:SAM-dependent methyltransferase
MVIEHVERYRFASTYVPGEVVIDAACGIGYGSRLLLDAGASKVYGYDISPDAMATAIRTFKTDGLVFERRDILDGLPERCDVFCSLETIEHIEYPKLDRYFAAVLRSLKEDGVYIVSTPNRDVTQPGVEITQKPLNPHHHFEVTEVELREHLERYFQRVEVYGQMPWDVFHFLHRLADRVASRALGIGMVARLARKFGYYRVMPLDGNVMYWNFIAVCQHPKR